MPLTDSDKGPVRYYGGFDIYSRAGIKKATFDKLAIGPWCPRPDIYIGSRPGWAPERAERWLKETGRIDIHGRPSRAERIGRPRRDEEPPEWYQVADPARYLTAHQAAKVLGRECKGISRMKSAGYGPRAAVTIRDLEGYEIDDLVRFGEQYGWVAPGGAEAHARWAEMHLALSEKAARRDAA